MTIRMLYFGWVREAIGVEAEVVTPPPGTVTVWDLVAWLMSRSTGHAAAFAEPDRLRVAIDQDLAGFDAEIAGTREIALFPPLTGGEGRQALFPFASSEVEKRWRAVSRLRSTRTKDG